MQLHTTILYVDKTEESRAAISLLNQNNFPYLVDPNPQSKPYTYPALEYKGKVVQGIANITKLLANYIDSKDLDSAFGTKPKLLTNKRVIDFTLGWIIASLYTLILTGKTTSFLHLVLATLPAIGMISWPYIWPKIKEQLSKEIKNNS